MISNLPGVKASDAVDLRGTKCVADGMYAQQVYGGSAILKAHTLLPGRDRDARFAPAIVMRRAGCCRSEAPGFKTAMRVTVRTSATRMVYLYGQGSSRRNLPVVT